MNWKLIFLLSLFGLAMGFGTVSLISSTVEPICWLVIFLLCAYAIARFATGRYFLHGLMVSIMNSVWITAVHITMFYTYIASHPEYLGMLPADLAGHPRRLMLLIGPITGILSGIVLGLFAWIASKIFKRSAVAVV